jgi:hypothetical protein
VDFSATTIARAGLSAGPARAKGSGGARADGSASGRANADDGRASGGAASAAAGVKTLCLSAPLVPALLGRLG